MTGNAIHPAFSDDDRPGQDRISSYAIMGSMCAQKGPEGPLRTTASP
jgi:hypothetical protein